MPQPERDASAAMNGGCLCGAVLYRLAPPSKFVVHCHCAMCRRACGAAFVTWIGVPDAQFELLDGADALCSYSHTEPATRQFCRRCGSPLFFRSSRWPGEVHATLASLIDQPDRPPSAHVFYNDRAAWLDWDAHLPTYGGASGAEPFDTA